MNPEASHGERITAPDRLDPAADGTELVGYGRSGPHLKARLGIKGLTERSGIQVIGVLVRDQHRVGLGQCQRSRTERARVNDQCRAILDQLHPGVGEFGEPHGG
jgi:hypothetical protein